VAGNRASSGGSGGKVTAFIHAFSCSIDMHSEHKAASQEKHKKFPAGFTLWGRSDGRICGVKVADAGLSV